MIRAMFMMLSIMLLSSRTPNCRTCSGSGACQQCKNNNEPGCRNCSDRDSLAGTWVGKHNTPAGTCQACR